MLPAEEAVRAGARMPTAACVRRVADQAVGVDLPATAVLAASAGRLLL